MRADPGRRRWIGLVVALAGLSWAAAGTRTAAAPGGEPGGASAVAVSLVGRSRPGPARAGEAPGADRLAAVVDSVLTDPLLPIDRKIDLLEGLLEGHGDSAASWVYRAAEGLGRLHLVTGDREWAIRYLELAVTGITGDADLLNTLGYLYAEEKEQLDRAGALVRGALALAPASTPDSVVGYYRDSLGWVFFQQGKLDSAQTEIEAANRLAPGTPEIRAHLIDTYDQLGRREDAAQLLIEDLVDARGVDPDLRGRLRRLYHTTPQGRPIPAELEVERRVRARDAEEIAAVEAAGGSVLRLQASDGFGLTATFYPAAGRPRAPAAVLLPMIGGSRRDHDALARALAQAGISALALDPRGHGGSVSADLPNPAAFQARMGESLHGAILDLAAAVQYLTEQKIARRQPIAVIGASLGGFVAALGTAGDARVKAVVLLSPAPAAPSVEAVAERRDRPTLLVAGEEDAPSRAAAEAMLEHLDRSRSQVATYPGGGHGTELLAQVPDLTPFLVRWLKGALSDAREL
jgi:dienelactone hydrolase